MSATASRFILASLAAGSFVMLGSASAHAQSALAGAQTFIDETALAYPDGGIVAKSDPNYPSNPPVPIGGYDCDPETFYDPDPTLTCIDANAAGSPSIINWSDYYGRTVGASFFTLSLLRGRGWTTSNIICAWNQGGSPNSSQYYGLINSQTGFQRITNVRSIQPDDIIVIGPTSDYNGHTMIVKEAPSILTTPIKPFVTGTQQFRVTILDSTSTAHGCGDARWVGPCPPLTGGNTNGGAGQGNMRIYANAAGDLVGYTWSLTSSNTSYYAQVPTGSYGVRPYSVGRVALVFGCY
jgi:hypothetical protein